MKTHWKKWSNSKYLGSWDFEPGEDKILTIKKVVLEDVVKPDGMPEAKRVIYFEEDIKPMICNNINSDTISEVLGSPYMEDWEGRGIILSVQKIQAYGKLTDAIRVRLIKPHECTECGKPIKGTDNETALQIKNRIEKEFGRVLCSKCASKLKEG